MQPLDPPQAVEALGLDLSSDQQKVFYYLYDWMANYSHGTLTFGGYAGCLSGDTLVRYNRGSRLGYRKIALRDLYAKFNGLRGGGRGAAQLWTNLSAPTYMLSHWEDGTVSGNRIVAVFESGRKRVIRIEFSNKAHLVLTRDHPILTPSGEYVAAGDLVAGDSVVACGTLRTHRGGKGRQLEERPPRVIVNTKYHPRGWYKKVRSNGISYEYKRVPRAQLVVEAAMNELPYETFVRALKTDAARSRKFKFIPKGFDVHHIDEDTLNDEISNLQVLPHGTHAKSHGSDHERHLKKEYTRTVKVTRIEAAGTQMTYDVQMEPPANNFVANGIFVHNTGKTTLLSVLAKAFDAQRRIAFCALSGRAASVLRRKLASIGIETGGEGSRHYCGTIHGLLYKPRLGRNGEIIGWIRNDSVQEYSTIILDEASMVSKSIYKDLASEGIPILAVGDHGQLPPVEGDKSFGLMINPQLTLSKIHRQAEGSPIIQLSQTIRDTGGFSPSVADKETIFVASKSHMRNVIKHVAKLPSMDLLERAFLCYRNATRSKINDLFREERFGSLPALPQEGEPVLCLKNSEGIYNGYRGLALKHFTPKGDHHLRGSVTFPEENVDLANALFSRWQWGYGETFRSFDQMHEFGFKPKKWDQVGHLFDYGYGLTVHKSQGSQFSRVFVVVERPGPVDDDTFRRWLYTAVTRAADRVFLFCD